ncbi:chromo domain-containing protein [Aspergillus saccharolyticus JOP 1030-1]|uniref:Heterochromatin protein n=1 Tax=Aspergillus saccharolyticus JOP 1030-1 TaxID=1450539 RepID=A0A319ADY3_9EURO|nr:heterochromatin protein [Aspergillus saccharolyticus JOP 1030-1]PYH45092.1 heterochromatin protein [Aspergillus saccharolyticus JOP 1030-1]
MSDDESTGESIPYEDASVAKRPVKEEKDDDNEDDEDDEEEEDVYHVEKIVGHEWGKKGQLLLQVKWKGYDDPADETFEPEENLDGAKDAVKEYFDKIGGRPEKPQSKKRKSMVGRPRKSTTPEKSQPNKRRKSRANDSPEVQPEEDSDSSAWAPKSKNWEKEVDNVDTIFREPGTSNLLAILNWKNGKKSKVLIGTCYERCPRKMLEFYESHLVFKEG